MTTEPMDDEDDKGRAADDGYGVPDLPAGERLDDFYTDDAILAIPGIKVTREVDSFWATLGDTPKAFGVVLLGFVSLPCIMIAAVPLLALAVVWSLIRLIFSSIARHWLKRSGGTKRQ